METQLSSNTIGRKFWSKIGSQQRAEIRPTMNLKWVRVFKQYHKGQKMGQQKTKNKPGSTIGPNDWANKWPKDDH
jgi:hypothetical protein